VSTWETLWLCNRGRLKLSPTPTQWISSQLAKVTFQEAVITHSVAAATAEIQLPHSDPADWLLAATARTYDLTLVTADENLLSGKGYKVLANR
jgi:PIN domain nuclease of toxin-antitoxin system